MLDRQKVKQILDLFFGGQPEKAYALCNDSNEERQFIESIKKSVNQDKAYMIMAGSDLSIFYNKPVVPYKDYPSFDVGY